MFSNTRDNLKGLLREQTAEMHQYDTSLEPQELLPYEFESYYDSGDIGYAASQWWQATAKEKLSTNLSAKQNDIATKEGKWLPEIDLAQEYLETIKQLNDIESLSDEEAIQLYNRQQELEPQLKELAKTNPYIRDLFYQTNTYGDQYGAGWKAHFQTRLNEFTTKNLTDLSFITPWKQLERAVEQNALSQDVYDALWNVKAEKNVDDRLTELAEAKEQAQLEYDNKTQSLIETQNALKKGNWYYDPSKLTAEYEKAVQNSKLSLTDPASWIYNSTHIGSSMSEVEMMLGQYGVSLLAKFAAKRMPAVQGAIIATEALASLGLAKYFRERETASEVFDNFKQKVTEQVMDKNINIDAVTEDWRNKLRSLGYEGDLLSDSEVFDMGLAQGLTAIDPDIEAIRKESYAGMDALRAVNNSLSYVDYLQSVPFSYGGKMLWNRAKDAYNASKLGSRVASDYAAHLFNKATTKELDNILYSGITKAASKLAKTPGKKAVLAETAKGATSYVAKRVGTGFGEMLEEGDQYIGGELYRSGYYDQMTDANISPIWAAGEAGRLGTISTLAYLGWDPTGNNLATDEELINSMKIGGFISLIFPTAAIQNVSDAVGLVKQYKNNNHLNNYLAKGYDSAEKDAKMDLFFNGLSKGGNNYEYTYNYLDRLRQYRPENVSDQMITEDQQLLDQMYNYYNNRNIKGILDDLGIKKGSDDHRKVMKNYLHLADVAETARWESSVASNSLEEAIESARNNVDPAITQAIDEWFDSQKEKRKKEDKAYNERLASVKKRKDKKAIEDEFDKELEQYRDVYHHNFFLIAGYNARKRAIETLIEDVKRRNKIISDIAEENGVSASVDTFADLLPILENQHEQYETLRKEALEESGFDPESIENLGFETLDKLQNQFVAATVSSAVYSAYKQKLNAYLTGRFIGESDALLGEISWDDLTDGQRQEMKQRYIKEHHVIDPSTVTEEDVLKWVNSEFKKSKKKKDGARQRFLADVLIQRDLKRMTAEEETAHREKVEDGVVLEDEVEEEQQQPTEETPVETPPQPTVTSETPPVDSMEDDSFDEQQGAIDALNELMGNEEPSAYDTTELLTPENEPVTNAFEDEELTQGYETEDSQAVATEEEGSNAVTEQYAPVDDHVEDTTETPVPTPDDVRQEENIANIAETVDDTTIPVEPLVEEPLATPTVTDYTNIPDVDPHVETRPEEKETKSTPEETPQPEIPSEHVIINTPDEADPTTITDVIIDPAHMLIQDGEIVMSPTGDVNDVIAVDPLALEAEAYFEDTYNQGLTKSSSEIQNAPGYAERVRGVDSLNKQKKNLIGSTFFYQPTAETPLEIRANGKEVVFTTKDGKVAKRGTGKQLAEHLAQPGWLSTADDIYYIVSDRWDPNRREAIKKNPIGDLAIHMIIEKDGVVYTASLRTTAKAQEELRRLGVQEDKASEDLNKLTRLRSRIIEAYCSNYQNDATLPSVPKKTVKPVQLRISNGSISNQKDGLVPIWRKLTEVGDLGVPSDPYELTDAIESGEVELGYGKGVFTLSEPFSIHRLDGSGTTSAQGVGYAGKIYIVPKVHQTPSQRVTTPIMLSEHTHDIEGLTSPWAKREDGTYVLELAWNHKHEHVNKNVVPTTAEIIYEMLTSTMFPEDVQDWLLTLLVNHGPKTVTPFESRFDMDHYVRKALHSYVNDNGDTMLIVGMAVNSQQTGREGKHVITHHNTSKINETLRRHIIFNIAKNLHWNTDKDFMMTRIPDFVVDHVVNHAKRLVSEGKFQPGMEIKLLGNEVAFTLEDVGYKYENGQIVKSKKDSLAPSVIAWMINHGKIKTDMGDHIFEAPFVYADDVSVQEEVAPQPVEQPAKPVEKKPVEQPKQESKTETPTETPSKRKTPVKATPENLAKYGLTLPEERPRRGFVYTIGFHKETGVPSVVPTPVAMAKKWGIYSTTPGTGKLKESKAREWLAGKLGIDPDDVFTTSSTIAAHSDKEAYGVLRVAWDRIKGQFRPTITLNTASGKTIDYHEAWHYVSLLLLTEKQRADVYADYRKRKNISNEVPDTEVEEMLAEEFRSYIKGFKSKIYGYRVQSLFNRLSRLLHLDFLNPSLHMQMFARIDAGEFKRYKPSQKVLKEFSQKYGEGVYYYIPGLSSEEQSKIPHISDANTFYNTVQSLSFAALQSLNIRTKEDLQKGLSLGVLFDELRSNLENGYLDELYEPLAQDVLDNAEIFEKYIKNYLQELNIDKFIEDQRANEKEDENRLATETGDKPDNTWDRNQGEVSKKENVATNAKLFFFSIPDSRYEYVRDEETGKVVREVTYNTDPMFGLQQPVPFSIAWNKILENLWDIDSIDEMIERCATLGETDPLFKHIHERLTDQIDPLPEQVLTQLEVTVKSSKNAMNTVQIEQKKAAIWEGMTSEQIEDAKNAAKQQSIWSVLESDNLRKIQRYPRQWSLAFFASNNVVTREDGKKTLNNDAWEYIQSPVRNINSLLAAAKRKGSDRAEIYGEVKSEFIKLCNSIMIPLDTQAFDYLIDMLRSVDGKGNPINELEKFRKLWESSDNGSFKALLKNMGSHTVGRGARALDKMFTSYNKDSIINLMAVAYGKTHPSPEEFSVTGADGALIYPISENNYMSDQVRWLNKDLHGKRQNILKTAYGRSSLLASNAGRLKLRTLIALEDLVSGQSRDYFGISPLEDYLTKMLLTENDQLVLPTMSDKKTWYSITGLRLLHEVLSRKQTVTQTDPETGLPVTTEVIGNRRFSDAALNIFKNYFLSEIDAVIEYYQNKEFVGKNPEYWRKNYHGKIKKGKVQPGGNGGRFRYFSTHKVNGKTIRINSELDKMERSQSDQFIINYLKQHRKELLENQKEMLNELVSNFLFENIEKEINWAVNEGIIKKGLNGSLSNVKLPQNLMTYGGRFDKIKADSTYTAADRQSDIIYSLFASHVLNTMISIQEVEKCFTGDSAFYKWSRTKMVYKPGDPNFKEVPMSLATFFKRNPEAAKNKSEYAEYEIITDMAVDKIKRLSSVLSPGTNLRTYWGEGKEHAEDNNTKYTVLNLKDNEISIPYYDRLKEIFKKSLVIQTYEKYHPEVTDDELFKAVTDDNMDGVMKEFTSAEQKTIEKLAENSAAAYKYNSESESGINQADAAVYMRPAMWRRIMRALGKWSDETQEAYEIMEKDDSWMSDPVLYQKATKLITNVQKMVYMGDTFDSKLGLDVPVFNKMAIFPMFKSLSKHDNRHLYDRMNNEELGTIDMLVFESAVKVGLGNTVKVYEDGHNKKLNLEELNKPSFTKYKQQGNLPTFTQDMKHLRLQMNTDAHEHMDRAMGTQAVKMFLSNIRDDRTYGENKGVAIKGEVLKSTIMECINELTTRGLHEIRDKYFSKRQGKWQLDNSKLSRELIKEAQTSGMSQEVIQGLGLDENGDFILPISALSSRNWIESRITSSVDKTVVDINTPGGSAVQMPDFGFKETSVIELGDNEIKDLGDGKPLKFLKKDGSMEVMLSTNFFRHIVPKEHQTSFTAMRNWLLENKIIGPGSDPLGLGYRIPTQGSSSTFAFTVKDVIPMTNADTIIVPDGFTAMTGSDFD